MKIVMVTGIQETDKDTIIDLALSRSKKMLPNFSRVDFSAGVKAVEDKIEESMDMVREELESTYDSLQKSMIEKMKGEGGHIVLNIQLAAKTMHGYVPLVPAALFKNFRPDVIVLMESDPREVAKTEEDIKEVRERQEINRHYATVYSMMYGAVLKILQVRKGSVTAAVNGLIETMKILL